MIECVTRLDRLKPISKSSLRNSDQLQPETMNVKVRQQIPKYNYHLFFQTKIH